MPFQRKPDAPVKTADDLERETRETIIRVVPEAFKPVLNVLVDLIRAAYEEGRAFEAAALAKDPTKTPLSTNLNNRARIGRLRMMADPDQKDWDLSHNDQEAIRWALEVHAAAFEFLDSVEAPRGEDSTGRLERLR